LTDQTNVTDLVPWCADIGHYSICSFGNGISRAVCMTLLKVALWFCWACYIILHNFPCCVSSLHCTTWAGREESWTVPCTCDWRLTGSQAPSYGWWYLGHGSNRHRFTPIILLWQRDIQWYKFKLFNKFKLHSDNNMFSCRTAYTRHLRHRQGIRIWIWRCQIMRGV
jgi:hypothetical protein